MASGAASSRSLVDAALARIAGADRQLNSFRTIRSDAARAEADAADARLAAGEHLPLLGVPIAIKDDMPIAGETTPFGTGGLHEPEPADGEVVRRLRAAGAIIVGKTTTPELGQFPFTEAPAFGRTRNPYALDRTPGGSSGGSAAAVAAGLVPAAVGSDGAGSIRIPAAWCGLVGIKPQRGRVPENPGQRHFRGLAVNGPLTRSVADAALLLDVLSGHVTDDAGPFAVAARREQRPLRIGLSWATPFGVPDRVHPDVRDAVNALAEDLRALGHMVIDAEPDHALAGALLVPRGMNGVTGLLREYGPSAVVEPRTRTNARLGALLGGPLVAGAVKAERFLADRMARVYDRVDVLLAPTTAEPALRVGQLDGKGWWTTETASEAACPFAFPWNVVGWPGINVPAGLDATGVPLGAQLLGRSHDEETLITLAAQLEQHRGWVDVRPPER
ncbi:Putative amidase AmiA2 [Paraconexibacter sp. AEG42_29]|uniref:Amidase AmiA2 n=1 Tax=Paraconexibacter sp. AEG42_29 TaxID=2997339 RepID=A0AAU7AS82_9ACTN